MDAPTYEELLIRHKMDEPVMEDLPNEDLLMKFASKLDHWETLAKYLKLSSQEIENLKRQGDLRLQSIKMLECWKQRCGQGATHKAMVKALLEIGRTDLAEMVFESLQGRENSPATPTSPASSSAVEDMSPLPVMSPSSVVEAPIAQDLVPTLTQFEEEFHELVNDVEAILDENEVHVSIITKRFRTLPQSIRRRHQTDEYYRQTRQKILDSRTTKELFDHLTALKHWSYMMPETLRHILKDVKIDDIHQPIDKYIRRLAHFKANTKLRELIGINFPVPDYCMELTMEVKGWKDKTIEEVESKAVNIIQRAVYSGQAVSLGWKGVDPGSVLLTFIFMEPVTISNEKLSEACKNEGVVSIQVDGEKLPSNDQTKDQTEVRINVV